MWYKQLKLFKLESSVVSSPEALHQTFSQLAFTPCARSLPLSFGWVPPVGNQEAPFVFAVAGKFAIRLRIEEKILPPRVVREKVKEAIHDLERKEQRKLHPDEKDSLKDDVQQTLLTQAFTQSYYVNAMIDTENNWLFVDTTSKKRVQLFLSAFSKTTGQVPQFPKLKAISPILTDWLLRQSHPARISIEDQCLVKTLDEIPRVARFNRHDLFSTKVQAFLNEGAIASQIGLIWSEEMQFTLHEDFSYSRIRYVGDVRETLSNSDLESEEDRFASQLLLMADTFQRWLDDFVPHFLA